MAKPKKMATLELIKQMAETNKETNHTLENLKRERLECKQQTTPKNVKEEVLKDVGEGHGHSNRKQPIKTNQNILKQLDALLHTDMPNSKKESFFMTMNGNCLAKYDKLAHGISYKIGIKTSRNDLMRKVLMEFTDKNYDKLIALIEKK